MPKKNYYRDTALKKRQELSIEDISEKSKLIYKNFILMPELKNSLNILCYLSSKEKKEVYTDLIILWLFKQKKNVYIPGTNWGKKEIKIYSLDEFPFQSNKFIKKFDIYEPITKFFKENSGENLDIIILPGSAGDNKGIRYGYGQGFFDRLLSSLRKTNKKFITILLLFDCQMFSALPKEKHDFPVDIIITEKEIIYSQN